MPTTIVRRAANAADSLKNTALHPILARIYAQRGITSSAELERGLAHLLPVDQLKGVEAAAELLAEAITQQQRILIVGDFDCDGATSSALAVRALRVLGAEQVDYLVPNRFEYGYGLTPEIVVVAAERKPDLIVTVDNGISSIDGVVAANECGIRVLVTDHHLQGHELPAAAAIVNPNQQGDEFPSKNLAGVGVIFYVMLALRAVLREMAWFEEQEKKEPNLAELLDLVALGTVADVVPLDHNNRILVGQGLARIRAGKCNAGISALIAVAKRNASTLAATDLGFALGPRLNAAGRLDDMSLGIELLLTDDPARAQELAQHLDGLNHERRAIEQEMKEEAMVILDEMELDEGTDLPIGLCLFEPHWHQGVIGILASRIKDRLHRPVIIFAQADDDTIKGSARSVPGLHIRDALAAVAAGNPGLLNKFGGHAMAAGMSLKLEDFERFRDAFDTEVRRHLGPEYLCREILSDGELAQNELNLDLAETLRAGDPWGQGFPEPLFDGVFELVSKRIVGEKHLKLVLRLIGVESREQQAIDAIAFNTVDDDWPAEVNQVELAYRLEVNEFNGRRSAQLLVEHIKPL